jgi:hypothetical protein
MNLTSAATRRGNDARTEAHRSIRIAGSQLGEQRHVCAFFNSREEEYRVTLPFIKDGFECGHKAFHLIGSARRNDHLQRLAAAGIDTVTTQKTGRFELRGWEDTYFSGGYFDPDRWLALLEEAFVTSREQRFPLTRVVAHMEWALEDRVGVDRLVEYEARVNLVWPRYKDVAICTYDLAKFGADVIIDIMRTHPMIIVGGTLQQNPFYVAPEVFLEELRELGAIRAGSVV